MDAATEQFIPLDVLVNTRVTHQNPSDLAMVRDWFYPEHQKTDPTIYTDYESDSAHPPSSPTTTAKTLNANRQKAIRRVGTYKFRDREKTLPHFIGATAELCDARVQFDEGYLPRTRPAGVDAAGHEQQQQQRTLSTMAMQSIFAMAFCRFVNGFVDRDIVKSGGVKAASTSSNARRKRRRQANPGDNQNPDRADEISASESSSSSDSDSDFNRKLPRSAGLSSMYTHAAQIGMPRAFVDFRHRCTHGRDLPPLREMQRMVDEALRWLWDRHWKNSELVRGGDARLKRWEVGEIERRLASLGEARERARLNREQQQEQQKKSGQAAGPNKLQQGTWSMVLDQDRDVWEFVYKEPDL